MTERLLVNQFAASSLFDATVGVYIAPGADLSVSSTLWTFYDVTDKVIWSDLVTIGFGRSDEQSLAQPATCDFTLLNDLGDFTPRRPKSRYYPYIRTGFPVKVVVNSASTGAKEQFTGYVDEIAPGWDTSTRVPTVKISAKGPIQRLQQGDAPRVATVNRAALDLTYRANVAAYWPMDGDAGTTSTSIGSGIGAGALNITGTDGLNFASFDGIPGSNPLPTFASGTNINGPVDGPADTTGAVYFRCLLNAATALTSGTVMIRLSTTGTLPTWRLLYSTGGALDLRAYNSSDAQVDATGPVAFGIDGRPFYLSVELVQNGGNVDVLVSTRKINVDGSTTSVLWTDSFAGTVGACTRIDMGGSGTMTDWAVGHIGVANVQAWLFSGNNLLTGYNSEYAHVRVARLASTAGIPMTVLGTTGTFMGPEGTSSLMDGLRDCEFANDGVLYDGLSYGLVYRCREAKQNRAVDMALDIRNGHVMPPFVAVENTQKTRNSVTASRPNGGSASYAQPSGQPYAVTGTGSVGAFVDSVSVNIDRDQELAGQAHWRVHTGTADLDRYPNLSLDFTAAPSLAASWLASPGIGARVTVTGLPATGGMDPDLVVEGYTMTLGPKDWRLDLNCSPAGPYDVAKVNDQTFRVDTRGAALSVAAAIGATSLTVDSDPPGRFSTSAGTFDLNVGGYKVSCTAISGAGTTQTFTVSSLPGPVAAGAQVKVWYPAIVSLEGDA